MNIQESIKICEENGIIFSINRSKLDNSYIFLKPLHIKDIDKIERIRNLKEIEKKIKNIQDGNCE